MLTTKYRPRRFVEMVGQNRPIAILRAILSKPNIPSTFLLYGSYGSGKSTAARIIAATVNCQNPKDADACGTCDSCIQIANGTSDGVEEIDAAVFGSVDNIRTIKDMVEYSTIHSYRVVIVDECHTMSKQAFDSLLKVMEEAPQSTIFVLVTTNLSKVPDTVRSRAINIYFGPVPNSEVVRRLREVVAEEGLETPDQKLLELIANNSGAMRDALKHLEMHVSGVDLVEYFGDESLVKNTLRNLLNGKDFNSEFEAMVSSVEPTKVVESLSDSFNLLYRKKAISRDVYKQAMDIVWTLVDVKMFDHRGKTITRLALRRLEGMFGK